MTFDFSHLPLVFVPQAEDADITYSIDGVTGDSSATDCGPWDPEVSVGDLLQATDTPPPFHSEDPHTASVLLSPADQALARLQRHRETAAMDSCDLRYQTQMSVSSQLTGKQIISTCFGAFFLYWGHL